MYTFKSTIRYSECGHDGKLTLTSLLDYFQDCSVFHSETAGNGYRAMLEKRIAWVLNAWQIEVKRYPALMEEVVIGTAPYDLKGFIGLRNFWMETKDGEQLAVANSVWSLVNLDTSLPERIPQFMLEIYPLSEKLPMEYKPRKLPFPQDVPATESDIIEVHTHHLDTNDHVNNGQYVKMAMDLIPECHVRELRAEYHRQAHLGDLFYSRIATRTDENGDRIDTIALNDSTGSPYCVIELLSLSEDTE